VATCCPCCCGQKYQAQSLSPASPGGPGTSRCCTPVYLASSHPTVTAALLLAVMLPFSAVSAQLRLVTGSLWPSMALHWTWNVLVYEILNLITTDDQNGRWTGEAGALTALCVLLLTAAVRLREDAERPSTPSERG
jgi:membrane protease YdiL (CAAX protease family)